MTEEVQPEQVAAAAPAVSLLQPAVQPYLRILHVNDSTDDQVVFQAACRKGNVPFNWHVADSAEKGISYLRTLVEQSSQVPVCWPDLILLDICMPLVSGFEVLKFVRATPELRHLPVVIFSGNENPRNQEQSMKLGANLFLLKPSDFDDIVSLARDLYRLVSSMKQSGATGAH